MPASASVHCYAMGRSRVHVLAFAVALVVLVVLVAGCGRFTDRSRQRHAPPHAPLGYVPVTIASVKAQGGSAVVELVSPSQQVVQVFVGGTEGQSLRLRSAGRRPPRPLTHDLLDSVLRELHGQIVQAQVDELRDGVFIGTLVVSQDGRAISLDARPSDAIALAVGAKAPIYMANRVLREAAIARDDDDSQGQSAP